MFTTTTVHVRSGGNLQTQASEPSMSVDSFRPDGIKVPKASGRVAMAEADQIIKSYQARFANAKGPR